MGLKYPRVPRLQFHSPQQKKPAFAGFFYGGEIGILLASLRALRLLIFSSSLSLLRQDNQSVAFAQKNNSPNCFLHSALDTQGYLGFQSYSSQQKSPLSQAFLWRRDRDSNPRYPLPSTIDFESTAFDHSAISPFLLILINFILSFGKNYFLSSATNLPTHDLHLLSRISAVFLSERLFLFHLFPLLHYEQFFD